MFCSRRIKPKEIRSILVSRRDAIGDVVLTLPLVGLLRRFYPSARLYFLGKTYTEGLISSCSSVDVFLNVSDWDELSSEQLAEKIKEFNLDLVLHVFPDRRLAKACKKAGIPWRVGTSSRWYHWMTCNVLPRLHRKNSDLHEAELNIELARLSGLFSEESSQGLSPLPTKDFLHNYYDLQVNSSLPCSIEKLLAEDSRRKVILHVGSRMSSRNWPLSHFVELADRLCRRGAVVYLTGTEEEGRAMRNAFLSLGTENVKDLTGQLSLKDLLAFIKLCDVLVAASTGPLHLAAALGIHAIGIYPPIRPLHPGRWAPLGLHAKPLVQNSKSDCRRCRDDVKNCYCMSEIGPDKVYTKIESIFSQ